MLNDVPVMLNYGNAGPGAAPGAAPAAAAQPNEADQAGPAAADGGPGA